MNHTVQGFAGFSDDVKGGGGKGGILERLEVMLETGFVHDFVRTQIVFHHVAVGIAKVGITNKLGLDLNAERLGDGLNENQIFAELIPAQKLRREEVEQLLLASSGIGIDSDTVVMRRFGGDANNLAVIGIAELGSIAGLRERCL